MFNFSNRRLFLYNQFTDMRKSYDTLAALVQNQMQNHPTSGDCFLFINKRKNRQRDPRVGRFRILVTCKKA